MKVPIFSEAPRIGGTLVWYCLICKRQVWLMSHGVEAGKEDEFLKLGRLVDESSYKRIRHSISFGDSKFDLLKEENGVLVIGEIKKSSRSIEAARLQLAHYLYELAKFGVAARGELLFPEERKREDVSLTEELQSKLDAIYAEIKEIVILSCPPKVQNCKYCRHCAYQELCWS